MLDETTIKKVQRLYYCKTSKKNPSKKIYSYRVWFGFWNEKGKQMRVYIGKELPDELKEMMKLRRPSSDGSQDYWPRSVHGKNAGDPGLLQVGDR